MRIYVPGTFDLFHVGHLRLFHAAKGYGNVVAGVNTDEFVERYKGHRPIVPMAERIELLLACRYVDDVIVNEGCEDSRLAILDSKANLICHGDDWTGDAYLAQLGVTQEWLDEHGISILHPPYTAGVSTSDLIERIRAADGDGALDPLRLDESSQW